MESVRTYGTHYPKSIRKEILRALHRTTIGYWLSILERPYTNQPSRFVKTMAARDFRLFA